MLELAIWLYHIGTPDLAVRIVTDAATTLFLLWGILNHYAKKEAEEAFLEVSREAHYWKMVANHKQDVLDKTRENLYKYSGLDVADESEAVAVMEIREDVLEKLAKTVGVEREPGESWRRLRRRTVEQMVKAAR